ALRRTEGAAERGLQDEAPARLGHEREEAVLQDRSVVHEDVDALVVAVEAIDERHRLLARDGIRFRGLGAASLRRDAPHRLAGALLVVGIREDGGEAVRGEPLGDRAADPARGSGDERDAAAGGPSEPGALAFARAHARSTSDASSRAPGPAPAANAAMESG